MKTVIREIRRSRVLDVMLFAAIIVGVLALLFYLPKPEPVEVSGAARVIDGDSIVVRGIEIRLLGIDAPEFAQRCSRDSRPWPCGAQAALNLRNRLRGRLVSCAGHERDVHGRLLAVCKVGSEDINRWAVEQGWAVSYDDYPGAERIARAAKRGIWSGTFLRPRDWREENR